VKLRHSHHHSVIAVVILLGLGFYAGQVNRRVVPDIPKEQFGKVLVKAGEAVSNVGQTISESTVIDVKEQKAAQGQTTTSRAVSLAAHAQDTRSSHVLAKQDTASVAVNLAQTTTSTSFRTNQACIDIIKAYESLRLEAYRGPTGKVLIGYGHSKTAYMGMKISAAKSEDLLREDLRMIEEDISGRLTRPVTSNQFSAMVCLAYNIGTGSFSTSTVLKETNAGRKQAAADAFLLWNKVRVNGKLEVSPHLDEKRRRERALYLES